MVLYPNTNASNACALQDPQLRTHPGRFSITVTHLASHNVKRESDPFHAQEETMLIITLFSICPIIKPVLAGNPCLAIVPDVYLHKINARDVLLYHVYNITPTRSKTHRSNTKTEVAFTISPEDRSDAYH
jgi:hypothetical protein